MHLLFFYAPEASLETVKDALFNAGAGKMGRYERASWETAGTGQFMPLPGSSPARGRIGETERLHEIKVEMVCADVFLRQVVEALLATHPYEVPAYGIIPIKTLDDLKSDSIIDDLPASG